MVRADAQWGRLAMPVLPQSDLESSETFSLRASFSYPPDDSSSRAAGPFPRRPPKQALAALAFAGLLKDGSLQAAESLLPDLLPKKVWGTEIPIVETPDKEAVAAVEVAFCNHLAAAFLETFAREEEKKHEFEIISETAMARPTKEGVGLTAQAKVKHLTARLDRSIVEKSLPSSKSERPKSSGRLRYFTASLLVALGVGIGNAATAHLRSIQS